MRKLIRKKIKEKKKFFLATFGVLIIFWILLGGANALYQKKTIVENNKEIIKILSEEKAAQINLFLENELEKLYVLASLQEFRDTILSPEDLDKRAIAKAKLLEIQGTYPGIGVMNASGIMMVAENNPFGEDYSSMPVFPLQDDLDHMFLRYYDSTRKKDYYAVVGPVYETSRKEKMIGLVGYDIELSLLSEIMSSGMKDEKGETYLINEKGLLLSKSSYVDQDNVGGILIQVVKSEGANDCLEDLRKYFEGEKEHGEKVKIYLNYVGEEVYGVHSYVPVIGGCVISERKVSEISKSFITGELVNRL